MFNFSFLGVFSIISRIVWHVNDTTHQKISNQPEFKRFSSSMVSTKKNLFTSIQRLNLFSPSVDENNGTVGCNISNIDHAVLYIYMQIHTFHEINMDGTNYRFSNFMKKNNHSSHPLKTFPFLSHLSLKGGKTYILVVMTQLFT